MTATQQLTQLEEITDSVTLSEEFEYQHSLLQILGIWLAVTLPMPILGFIVGPAIEPLLNVDDTLRIGTARTIALGIGLVWQFVFSIILVRMEEGDLKISTIKRRLRLNKPVDPRSGRKGGRVWLWFIPFALLLLIIEMGFSELQPFFNQIPGLAVVERYDLSSAFSDPELQQLLVGAWWFFALFFTMLIFNTVLGEEFLFRGILLPKMKGVFGKYDWVANGVLMGAYHLHQPWTIPGSIVASVFVFSYTAKRYRSTWMAIALHSIQTVIFGFLVLGLVLGLA